MNEQNPGSLEGTATLPTLVDGCGCIPAVTQPTKPIEAVETEPTDPGTSGSAPPTASQPSRARRSYKIVLNLEAATDGTFHAVLAVGSPDCDPRFEAFDVPDVAAALAAVPALLGDAEAAWDLQPRYPIARTPTKSKTMDRSAPTDGSDQASPAQPAASQEKPTTSPSPARTSSGQLSLFG